MSPDPPPPARRPGSLPARIGRYRIVERIGRGAMGVVYAAQDDAMGRPVAVKVLMGDLESDPETRKRFYREAQAAAGLLHPNIITIYDAGEDQGRSYIAMQLLEGWPLSTFLKRDAVVPLEQKLDLMVQVCEGLAVAHARGIVHRDLKPGNLFVQSDGLLKILDFGVARLADSSMTATGMMLGTPDYMSPEQARGAPVDARSDIFSVGAVFYFMLAGHKPFPGPDLPAVLRQLQFEEPTPLSADQAPADLAQLVMQALAKEPVDRPQRVQDLLAGLVRIRRQCEAGARKLATEAGARYRAVLGLLEQLRQAGEGLGLTHREEPLQSPDSPIAELRAAEERLTGEIARRVKAVDDLAAGSRVLAEGDARGALRLVEPLRAAYPDATAVAELYQSSLRVVRELDARDARVRDLLSAGRAAFESSDWSAALDACDAALKLSPNLPVGLRLRSEIQTAAADEARRRAEQVKQLLGSVTRALDQGRFDDVETLLDEVQALEPDSEEAREWRTRVEQARRAAAAAERLRRLTADQIRRARGTFRRGRYEEAVAALRAFAGEHPASIEASEEAARLEALWRRYEDAMQARRQEVATLVQAARRSAEAGRLDEAIAGAASAVRHDPCHADAAALLDELVARDLEACIERERARADEQRREAAAGMMATAREAQARGYLAFALEAALGAERVARGSDETTPYVAELRRLMQTDDEQACELGPLPFVPREALPEKELPRGENPPRGEAAPRASDSGVLASVNQWAADLKRRLSNR